MNGRRSATKGANGERELMAYLAAEGYPTERGGTQSYGERPDLSGLDGIHIECKRVEALNVSKAMRQAEADSEKFRDGFPAVFHRKNREPWLVTMHLRDWMILYRRWQSESNQ